MGKEAEKRLVAMAKHFRWYRHKYGDVRYCVNCRAPQPKTENAPDYAIAPLFTWVECKNSDSTGRWRWAEIAPDGDRANQREWLIENTGWLFIELGTGRAPEEKGAWLIPMDKWISDIEPVLEEKNMKSIRLRESRGRPGADTLLKEWECTWEPNIGWVPRKGHPWWTAMYMAATALRIKIGDLRGDYER